MSNAEMMERLAMASPRLRARFVASYYLLTILTGAFLLFFHGRLAFAADVIASVCYLAVTALFYDLSKPVNRSLFLLAALFNLVARALGKLSFHASGRIADSGASHRDMGDGNKQQSIAAGTSN